MRFFLIAIVVLCGSFLPAPTGRGSFGVCISYQASGEMKRYIMYMQNGGNISMKRTVMEDELVKYASGYWPSVYNPMRVNYFEQEGLHCKVIFNDTTRREYPLCSPMDSLWKVRFKEHPFDRQATMGWSNKAYRPSPQQEQYLFKEFNVQNIDRDYFADSNFWKLLRYVSDPDWIDKYKSIP